MSLDHIGLGVGDIERAKAFYGAALAPLGLTLMMEVPPELTGGLAALGFGKDRPFFWISGSGATTPRLHIAFTADSREAVNAFHAAAMAAGAQDNGAPGLRPHYHPNYYGAFVLDPDGHNIEAVCHRPA
jgi:catechol 2,3-dioxygenase-like lactoylglutathione lyase family enzyme